MSLLEDSGRSPRTLLLILSIRLHQTLALPFFPHRGEAAAVEEEALGEAVLLGVDSEVVAAAAGNPTKPNIRQSREKANKTSN